LSELSGRLAVVTGAAGGIGGAIARALIAAGATVHGLDRDVEGQRRLAQEAPGRFVTHTRAGPEDSQQPRASEGPIRR